MCGHNRIIVSLFLLGTVFNGCSRNQELGNDTEKWKKWTESSSEGLWENDDSRSIVLTEEHSYGGDNDNVPVYAPLDADISGDTLFATDWASDQVFSYLTDGTLLWKAGGSGEGPGYFSGIGNLSVGDSIIAVCNRKLSRVDILNRFTGEWEKSIPILWPYDVDIAGDTLAVANVGETELITLYSLTSNEVITTMGCDFWEENSLGKLSTQGNANLNIAIENGYVVLSSYFQKSAAVFDVSTGTIISRISREMPVDRRSPHDNAAGGVMFSVYIVDCDINDGIIYITNAGYGKNGTITQVDSELVDITVVDRYNLNGDYLDSVVLPQIIATIKVGAAVILTVDTYYDGVIKLYSML